ncbi:MAG: hypothetical protein ABJB61_07505 [bacterium]
MRLSSLRKISIGVIGFAIAAIVGLFAAQPAFAQSSGNFASSIATTQCTINTAAAVPTSGGLSPGIIVPVLDTYIKTPNSQFTTLLIRPSLVTGLFNNTQVTGAMETSANSAAVVVTVTLDGKAVAPDTGGYSPIGIIYDQRFQQLSSNVFDAIASCSMNNNCSIDLIESTLAAHSFDFVAPNVGGGNHHLVVSWAFECTSNGVPTACSTQYTTNTAGACAGSGTVTVTQTKAFSQSGGITIGP